MGVLTGIIPRLVPGRFVVLVMRVLSAAGGRLSVRESDEHFADNARDRMACDLRSEPGFIEDQEELRHLIYGKNRRGRGNVAYSGCGIIAVWNAMTALGLWKDKTPGTDRSFARLISEFERKYAVAGGNWGSVPSAAVSFFREKGCRTVSTHTRDAHRLDRLGKEHSVFIVTAFNDRRDIRKMLHTVCIEKRDGRFIIHNGYRKNRGRWTESEPYSSLSEAAAHIGSDPVPVLTVAVSRLP